MDQWLFCAPDCQQERGHWEGGSGGGGIHHKTTCCWVCIGEWKRVYMFVCTLKKPKISFWVCVCVCKRSPNMYLNECVCGKESVNMPMKERGCIVYTWQDGCGSDWIESISDNPMSACVRSSRVATNWSSSTLWLFLYQFKLLNSIGETVYCSAQLQLSTATAQHSYSQHGYTQHSYNSAQLSTATFSTCPLSHLWITSWIVSLA